MSARPDIAEFGWALAIGLMAAALGLRDPMACPVLRPPSSGGMLLATPAAGLAVAGLAIAFAAGTGQELSRGSVLRAKRTRARLSPIAPRTPVAALVLLIACKALAYSASLSGFRGGPVFPSMFLGAAAAWRCRTWPDCR